jgi:SAM-dependent methyltransferase
MTEWIIAAWPILIQGVLGAFLVLAFSFYLSYFWGAPFVPSTMRVSRRMLELADVQPGQKVVDLGAGDGRVVILAARRFGAQATGVEIDPTRWFMANLRIWQTGLRGKASVRLGDMRTFDVSGADVVTLYLLQGTNQKLKERLQKSLMPGAKIVSHCFSMSGWTPVILDDRNGIFVYEIGNTGEDAITKFR